MRSLPLCLAGSPAALAFSLSMWTTSAAEASGGGGGFVVRTHDAIARPGHMVAVVLSTYEPQPIEQGQLCVTFRGVTAPLPDISLAYATMGDAVLAVHQEPSGELMLALSSATATINAEDGPMVVLWFDVGPAVRPGTTFPIAVDPAMSWLQTDTGQVLTIDPAPGQVTVVPRTARYAVSAEGDNIAPGEVARLSVETNEPLGLLGGDIALRYDPAIAAGPPVVRARSRDTALTVTPDLSQPGLVRVHVEAATPTWNWIPGPLIEVLLPTSPLVPVGTISPIRVERAGTILMHPTLGPLPLTLGVGDIEFR